MQVNVLPTSWNIYCLITRWLRPKIDYPLQIWRAEILTSGAPCLRLGVSLACISVSWICSSQLIIQSLSAGDEKYVPNCWKVLQTCLFTCTVISVTIVTVANNVTTVYVSTVLINCSTSVAFMFVLFRQSITDIHGWHHHHGKKSGTSRNPIFGATSLVTDSHRADWTPWLNQPLQQFPTTGYTMSVIAIANYSVEIQLLWWGKGIKQLGFCHCIFGSRERPNIKCCPSWDSSVLSGLCLGYNELRYGPDQVIAKSPGKL